MTVHLAAADAILGGLLILCCLFPLGVLGGNWDCLSVPKKFPTNLYSAVTKYF